MFMSRIIAVCTSRKKGTKKTPIAEGIIRENYGLDGDGHAGGTTQRQISLLAVESINNMRDLYIEIGPGVFAENLTTQGIDLVSLPAGTYVSIGKQIILEITQIGKECRKRCAIYHQAGQFIMPQEGIFAKVIRGGMVKAGDPIRVQYAGYDTHHSHNR
jgi:MOSC domain-containing protein YiiM